MLLLLCFALAFAIQGAAAQAWSDGSRAAHAGYVRTCGATKDAVTRGRASQSRTVRWGSGAAAGVGAVLGGLGRLVLGAGRAVWVGGKQGWLDGRRRGARRWARRRTEQRRRRNARAGEPTWTNWVTGRCPQCGHTTTQADEQVTCSCRALDWGCACARRTSQAAPPDLDKPDPPMPTPVGGDGSAASADPAHPEPTIPPARIEGDDDMTAPAPVVEVTTYGQARRAMTAFVARATTFLDLADRAEAEADAASREAAALEVQAEQMAAGLAGNEFDAATLAEIEAMHERATALRDAAAKLKTAAVEVRNTADALSGASATALSGITTRHDTLDEAHKSAPVRAARREGYEE